ncbi:MAG: hypothetical protein Q4G16_02035, partial [Cruoricaptor ignavus]|nr:hypothetical protein [Cruoricaptor ignavus]
NFGSFLPAFANTFPVSRNCIQKSAQNLMMRIFKIFLFGLTILSCNPKDKIEEQTIFSSESVKDKFSKELLGKTKNEILETLGKPVKEEKMTEFDAFLYTKNKDDYDFYEGFDIINPKKNSEKKTEYLYFSFRNDTVKKVLENLDENFDEKILIGKSKNDIIESYGIPIKKVKCNNKNTILSFTDRGNGDLGVKMPEYYFKNIVLNENNVAIKVIDTINKDLNINKFACEE